MIYCQKLLSESAKLADDDIKSRSPLLTRYLDNKPDREAAALNSLEELMDQLEHPSGLWAVLASCFDN